MGQRLLVRVPNWLGDCIMSLGALSGLVRTWPDTAFWGDPRVSDVFQVFFPGVPVVPADALPGPGFARLLLLTDSFRSAYRGWRAGIPERLGHRGQFRSAFLTRSLGAIPGRDHHHSVDYDRLAGFAGAEAGPPPAPAATPKGPPHIAVFAGAAYGGAKVWPGYAGLLDGLRGKFGLDMVLYGAATEAGGLRALSSEAGGVRVEASLSLGALCRRLLASVLAVGNDSGGVHLAAALGVPTIAIFGSTDPVWTAPRGRSVRVLAGSSPCSPCFARTCRKGGMSCFDGVGIDDVLRAAADLLGTKGAG